MNHLYECDTCLKKFKSYLHNKRTPKYCSRKCYYNREKINYGKCKLCKKELKFKYTYCSVSCKDLDKRKTIICKNCGIKKSVIKSSKMCFCSQKCVGLSKKKTKLYKKRQQIYFGAKHRAFKKNLEFNLDMSDISIPKKCPALNIEIDIENNKLIDNSPTLDRIDNKRGYVKDNIQVISFRANALKRDGTIEELERLLTWLKLTLNNNKK